MISHIGKQIYEEHVQDRYISLQMDLLLSASYNVTVIPVTHVEGASASTKITFHKTGRGPLFSLYVVYFHDMNLSFIIHVILLHIRQPSE